MRISFLLRRLALLVLVLWTAATINFFMPRLTPRNPIREKIIQMAQTGGYIEGGIEEMVAAYEVHFGLDLPLWQQYISYVTSMFRLDMGYSLANYPRTVNELVGQAAPWTIGLLGTTTILSFVIGNILGALIAWPKAPRFLGLLVAPLMTLAAVPFYVLALILLYFIAFRANLLPLGGGYPIGVIPSRSLDFYWQVFRHSILPALSIILAALGGQALGMRGMMVTVQGEDYMTLGEAKGLTASRLFFRYGLRNAMLPQVTGLALSLGQIVSGAVLVEIVFRYPGIGSLLATAIQGFDYFLIYGIVFLVILGIAIATLLLDLTYPLMDPRIQYEVS